MGFSWESYTFVQPKKVGKCMQIKETSKLLEEKQEQSV